MRTLRRTMLVALALVAAQAEAQALDFARDPDATFELGSHAVGESPAHGLSFSVRRGELEMYRATVTYPEGFRFKGFDALGPAGTEVGALTLDFNADDRADLAVPLRSLSPGSAYADVIPDGRFSPGLEPVLRHAGLAVFVLHLPFGGDANASTVVAFADTRLTFVMLPGLLVNPSRAGAYVVTAELVSVDPDTGGGDDGAGAAPLGAVFELSVPIEGQALVPFAALCVDKADVVRLPPRRPAGGPHDDGHGGDRFSVHGRYALGAASNGVALGVDTVTVTLGVFTQEVPGAAFSALGRGARFASPGAGITRLHLHGDGRFEVEVRGLDLHGLDLRQPVPFAVQLGDDRGETSLRFDHHGHVRSHPGRCRP